MYLKYGLHVAPAILITALAAWLFLLVSGRANRSNNRILAFSTISALAVALLAPVIAGTLLETLSLSILFSVVFAFLLCSLVLCAGFILAHIFIGKGREPDADTPAIPESHISESAASPEESPPVSAEPEDGCEHQIIVDTGRNIDKIGVEENSNNEEKVKKLLENAIDCKMQGRFTESVACYREILDLTQDKNFALQIIIEICGILKSTGSAQLIPEILDSAPGNLPDSEIKAEIMNNI